MANTYIFLNGFVLAVPQSDPWHRPEQKVRMRCERAPSAAMTGTLAVCSGA